MALWLYAATQGVGSARELERLCEYHEAYRWLCGGVPVNYHTLSDFRVDHEEALDGLMTEVLAMLMERKLVSVHRISQDGLRVRASAGKSSFRREQRLNGVARTGQGPGGGSQGPAGGARPLGRNARRRRRGNGRRGSGWSGCIRRWRRWRRSSRSRRGRGTTSGTSPARRGPRRPTAKRA